MSKITSPAPTGVAEGGIEDHGAGSKQNFFVKWRTDIILLLASAICFAIFTVRSINQDQISGIGGPIAFLSSGSAERKASGTNVFRGIFPKANLYNLDAIWVGKGETASIMMDGDNLKLSERTLLILKRPFRQLSGLSSVNQGLKILKGKVETDDGQTLTPVVEVPPPALQDTSNNGSDNKSSQIKLHPADHSTLYMRVQSDIPVLFAWPNPITGYVDIHNTVTGHHTYSEVSNQKSLSAKLEGPGAYQWQMVDPERRPILGPFSFVIKHLDEAAAKALLQSRPDQATEVYW